MPRMKNLAYDTGGVVEAEPLEVSVLEEEPLHGVKLVYRDIAGGFPVPDGAWNVEAVDAYISSFLNSGWMLKETHCPGRRMENAGGTTVPVISMVYVLEK